VSSSPLALPLGYRSLRPQRLSTRRQVHQSYLNDYDYSRRFFDFSRVLTFNNAGHGQRSLGERRFGLRLRGGSGLPSVWCGFLFRHRCGGFIPLPGEIRRFPVEYTSRLSIKFDYHIKCYSEDLTLTGSTGLPSQSGRRGCWRCPPVRPRRAPPPAPL
jgi:hypothetical protein